MDHAAADKRIHELAHEIGSLFINFAGFDHLLNLALGAALGLTVMQERALLRGMYSRPKIEMLESFAKRKFDAAAYEALKKLTKEAKAVADFRNDIAHGLLTYDDHGNQRVLTFRGDNRFDGKETPLSPEIVAEYSIRTADLAVQFQGLLNAIESAQGRPLTLPPVGHPPK